VTQLTCTDVEVAALACTLVMATAVGDGVGLLVCPLLGPTTPAHPTKLKLNVAILRTTVSD
jgi:hypothetical protein